jgi:ribosome-binding ATPase YchF (GTP1/OBG family)
VLGAERLEHELRRLEPPRDVEVARDELVHATDGRTLAQWSRASRSSPAPVF